MRKISIAETLKTVNFITANGMTEEVQQMALLAKSGKKINIREVGIQFIVGCISKLTTDKAIDRLFEILAGPFEMDAQELKNMDTEKFFDLFVQFLDTIDAENIKGFFKSVAVSMEKFR
jgi:hypothetical protein